MKIPKNQTVPALWLETIGIFASEDMFLITPLRMATAYPEMIAGQQKRPASFFHPYNSTTMGHVSSRIGFAPPIQTRTEKPLSRLLIKNGGINDSA